MKKFTTLVCATALVAFSAPAFAEDNGLAVGQDPLLLAATKCGNKGIGNGGELLRFKKTKDGLKIICRKNVGGAKAEESKLDVDPGNS